MPKKVKGVSNGDYSTLSTVLLLLVLEDTGSNWNEERGPQRRYLQKMPVK